MAKGKTKRSRSKKARRSKIKWASLGAAALTAGLWVGYGPQLRELSGLVGEDVPGRGDSLRVVSWNLANFRGDPEDHDLERIAEVIEELDADVIAVQEIKDPEALAALLSEYELRISDKGGRGRQLLGVAWRPDRVELLTSEEHAELSIGGRVRPALSAYLRGRGGGPDFWLTVVHLKAMPDGLELRREQWPTLAKLADGARETEHYADEDLLILGDFNTTGPPGGGPPQEQAELAKILAPSGLRRLSNSTGCTCYYDGERRDAWKEASEIDLVWARGFAESLTEDAAVRSGTHCAAKGCQDFRSTRAYPLRDYASVSDHCPVIVDLERADDD